MNVTEARNILVRGLYEYFSESILIYRSGQVNEEQEPPYIIYSILSDNGSGQAPGHYSVRNAGEDAEEIRQEQTSATMSVIVCSQNRQEGEDYIYGEDEAQELAERCKGWFIHDGYDYLSANNIVIADVTAIQNRNTLMVSEEANRKGFDVMFNYMAEETRSIPSVHRANTKRKQEV
ncbi:MAG: hypothetical protein K2O16_03070 [Lachnospiraceae bacterium]|nr:hypothetical protein [Lachnospiraceae bacterium]